MGSALDFESIISTRLTAILGIKYPLIQAGMGYLARAEMAAAVSDAGGLGVIGSSGDLTPDGLAEEIATVKAKTQKPFGVNFLFPQYDDSPIGRRKAQQLNDMVDVALDHNVAVLGAGLGVPPRDVISRAKKTGTMLMCTTGATRHVVKAQEAGLDFVIAQGWEAGGHNSRVGTMALLPQVARVADIPFVAAGGIASGSGLVASLALGASAVYMGTVFASSVEAQAHQNYKNALLDASETDTVVSTAHSGKPCRLLKNKFTDYYEQFPEKIRPFPEQFELMERRAQDVRQEGKVEAGGAPAGQIAGLLQRQETAGEIVERIIDEAREVIEQGIGNR